MPENLHFYPPITLWFTLKGSYLPSLSSVILFTNSPCQIKDPKTLSTAYKLRKAPLLRPNQVIWTLEWRQKTWTQSKRLPSRTAKYFNAKQWTLLVKSVSRSLPRAFVCPILEVHSFSCARSRPSGFREGTITILVLSTN